jgi:hypothetical protein
MIAATVTLSTTAQSLRALIDAATPGQLTPLFTNRVCEVQIQVVGLTDQFFLVYKPGIVSLATDAGFFFQGLTDDATGSRSRCVMRTPTGNQLSLADIYLVGAVGGEQAAILANTI